MSASIYHSFHVGSVLHPQRLSLIGNDNIEIVLREKKELVEEFEDNVRVFDRNYQSKIHDGKIIAGIDTPLQVPPLGYAIVTLIMKMQEGTPQVTFKADVFCTHNVYTGQISRQYYFEYLLARVDTIDEKLTLLLPEIDSRNGDPEET